MLAHNQTEEEKQWGRYGEKLKKTGTPSSKGEEGMKPCLSHLLQRPPASCPARPIVVPPGTGGAHWPHTPWWAGSRWAEFKHHQHATRKDPKSAKVGKIRQKSVKVGKSRQKSAAILDGGRSPDQGGPGGRGNGMAARMDDSLYHHLSDDTWQHTVVQGAGLDLQL